MGPLRAVFVSVPAIVIALLAGCGQPFIRPVLHQPDSPPARTKEAGFLKVHTQDGLLYLLDSWQLSADKSRIDGHGTPYSAERLAGPVGTHSIPVSKIALLETDRPESGSSGGVSALGFMTVVFGGLSIYCSANPKSCFGSCPTFYLDETDTGRPLAEGFSSSIARALEARDVDALFGLHAPQGRRLSLAMRNEALETHSIGRVRLLAAPRPRNGRVLAVGNGFREAFGLRSPMSCRAAEGDCREQVARWDGDERASAADENDLATRKRVELAFPATSGSLGLVVGARQTLLSTFLFYQTMAHFGRQAGELLASVERGATNPRDALAMARVLGGIDVEVAEGDGAYRSIGSFDEAGPIAGDVAALPFEAAGNGVIHVRLKMARGHWRLDYLALARLGRAVVPVSLEPVAVEKNGRSDRAALAIWHGGEGHVVTLPGDVCRIHFALPRPGRELELFLETEGFYYEWMRQEWLQEEDPALALLSISRPEEALRRLAPAYKKYEPELEGAFWASRFRR